jgi:hypothetical protein
MIRLIAHLELACERNADLLRVASPLFLAASRGLGQRTSRSSASIPRCWRSARLGSG